MSEDKPLYEIAPGTRVTVIQQKISVYHAAAFDAELDAKIAKALDNRDVLTQAEKRLKDCLRAIALLEEMLTA